MLKIKILLTLLTLLTFTACGGGQLTSVGSSGEIRGKILIKGHLPQSYVGLKVNSRLYYNIVGNLSQLLKTSYHGKEVTLSGRIISKAVGPGMPARFEATKIVAVHKR